MKYAPKKVFIMKDGGYQELTFEAFCALCESDSSYKNKHFIPLHGMLMEVTMQDYKAFYKARRRQKYLKEQSQNNRDISIDMLTTEEFKDREILLDASQDVADQVVNRILLEKLCMALPLLDKDEQELILTIIATYAVTMIFTLVVVKSSSFGNVPEMLIFTLNKAFLLIAYGCVGVLISFVLKKSTAGLIISMGYSFMFANLIYTGINQIVNGAGISDTFDVQTYTLVGNTISLSQDISSEQQLIVVIVCSVAIILSFVISSILFIKRDI